uniref:Uncharacterized protein n=1 Tax=Molossus molossus TaxID=27622 RepID=A0A7J8I9H6_MOLMO|nr:hypothetical protein HJG59_010694 [Molossus molossus]
MKRRMGEEGKACERPKLALGSEVGRGVSLFVRSPCGAGRAGQVARCCERADNSRTPAGVRGFGGGTCGIRTPGSRRICARDPSSPSWGSRKKAEGVGRCPRWSSRHLAHLPHFSGAGWSLCPGGCPGVSTEKPVLGRLGRVGSAGLRPSSPSLGMCRVEAPASPWDTRGSPWLGWNRAPSPCAGPSQCVAVPWP